MTACWHKVVVCSLRGAVKVVGKKGNKTTNQ